VVAESDFHSLYFSRGVLLEADLVAHQLQASAAHPAVHRVVQVYRGGDVGAAAAARLATKMRAQGIEAVNRTVSGVAGGRSLLRR